MRQILDIERMGGLEGLGDSQSLYFTPAGTPLREALALAALNRNGLGILQNVFNFNVFVGVVRFYRGNIFQPKTYLHNFCLA